MSVIHFHIKDLALIASALTSSHNSDFVIERVHRLSVSNAKAYFDRYGQNAEAFTIEEIKKNIKYSLTKKERIDAHEKLSSLLYNSDSNFQAEKIYLLRISNDKLSRLLAIAWNIYEE